jgi:hypothetical protein
MAGHGEPARLNGETVPACDLCGGPFDLDGYHVIVAGRRYDSIDCALRAQTSSRRADDATRAWIAAAKERLGVDEKPRDDTKR